MASSKINPLKTYTYETVILERHLDSFGHVNNAVYLELFEEARWDFITKNGWGLERIKEEARGPVILSASVQFKKELKNRSNIKIVSHFEGMKNRLVMVIAQAIYGEDGELCASAIFESGMMDLLKRKLIAPPDDYVVAMGGEVVL